MVVLSGRYPGSGDYAEGSLSYRFIGSDTGYIKSTFGYAFQAARFIKAHSADFDIVVEDFAPWNPVFSFIFSKRPVALHVNHREGLNILKRWPVVGIPFYLIERFYPRFFIRVTALSEWTKKKFGLSRAQVLPAGVDEALFRDIMPALRDDGFVLYVGRLHIKNKGLDTLIEALRGLNVRLVLAGRGRDEEGLKDMARGLDVEFRGFVSEAEKMELMQRASLLILPSRFEGWGIVVLEAAVCGKPVIVSDIPELDYAVKGGYGISFRRGDAVDLREKLKMLMEDSKLRQELGLKARRYAEGFTWQSIAEDYEVFLKGVINPRSTQY